VRTLTMAEGGGVDAPQVLICDRDRKWSGDVSIPGRGDPRRPHSRARAQCERVRRTVRTIDQRRMPHGERNHQGLGKGLISGLPVIKMTSRVRRHPRLGGLLNFYERAA
jgi:hypothetical protein